MLRTISQNRLYTENKTHKETKYMPLYIVFQNKTKTKTLKTRMKIKRDWSETNRTAVRPDLLALCRLGFGLRKAE